MMMLYLPSGSPTAELFAASYNNTGKSNTITLKRGTYGYFYKTDRNWLKTTDNHGIYNKSTSSSWWLASPSFASDDGGPIIDGRLGYILIGSCEMYAKGSVRPIVCIPTFVFEDKYASSLVNE